MAISITPSPFGSVTVTLDGELGGVLSVGVLATSNSALNMDLGVPGPAGATGATGAAGTNGTNGTNGVGVPVGGTAGQVLAKINSTNYNTEWVDAGAAGDFLPLAGGTMSGTIFLPSLRNLLNTDLTVTAYNDTGAGTNYVHTFDAYDGTFALATNGGGLKFPDATVQVTAGLPLTGGTVTANASVNFSSNVYPETPFLNFIVNDGGEADFGGSVNGGGFNFYDNNDDTRSITAGYYDGFTHTNGDTGLSTTLNFNGIIFPDSTLQTTAFPPADGTTAQYIDGTGALETFPPLGDRYFTTSNSTLTCDSGNGKTMTIDTGLSYSRQQDITVSYNNANHMHGTVLTYDSATGVMTFDSNTHSGSGTFSSWEVNVGGVAGAILPVGGTAGQVLAKINSTNFNTEWVSLGSMANETATDYLAKAGNLSGLANTSTARTNLGLGTAATQSTATFLQTANNLSDVTASTARTNLGLGSMAIETASDYLSKAGNLSGLANTATARTNLGLGSASTLASSAVVQTANNLSDVTASTARTNLGLGAVSTDAYATTAQAQAGTSTTTVISPATFFDARWYAGGKSMVQISWSTAVSGAGAAAGAQNSNARLNVAPTTATGYAIASANIANNSRGTVFNAGFDFSKRVAFGLRVARNVASPDTASVWRFSIGKNSATDASDISARGLQVKVAGSGALQLLVHNGTTLTTTTSSYTPANGVSYDIVVTSDGAGAGVLYVNGSSVATSSGGPTTAGASNAGFMMFEVQNTSVITASPQNICISDYFVQVNS